MPQWVRFKHSDKIGTGTLDGNEIVESNCDTIPISGEGHQPTGRRIALDKVELLAPFQPRSILGLWNNFHERAAAEKLNLPAVPLYFMKPPMSMVGPGQTIMKPKAGPKAVIFEAELGIVIGKQCCEVSEAEAPSHVFGFCCVNDVTAVPYLKEDSSFQQWTRSKGFDTFTPIGPNITTSPLPLETMRVQAVQNGVVRQNYPVADMIFSPYKVVSMISHYQTLWPGDLIACGTSVGAKTLKDGDTIDIVIDGIGSLSNKFADPKPEGKSKL
jgi:2-keto-4-pentenoate hydratase/2-oxohepta-3-ene-1,7-dioic acid hydratase in catechol pathway